jgi:tyrosine-protein kinase Etk/Wzc
MESEPQREAPGQVRTSEPTHLSDYVGVVTRRIWLVLAVFAVTTASAIWAVARQTTYYQSQLTLQVNDPIEPARGLVNRPAVSAMVFVDPIESEMQVLRSSSIARGVVDSLGLRLVPAGERVRSELMRAIEVDPAVRPGSFDLVYTDDAAAVALRDETGTTVATAPVGERLAAGGIAFRTQPPPAEDRSYPLRVVPYEDVVGEVSASLSASPRENTNLIDVHYVSEDPVVAPRVLNAAAAELRLMGARKVSAQAAGDMRFIEEQLDSARRAREAAAAAIQRFKESREFTTLSSRESRLVTRLQEVQEEMDRVEGVRGALSDISRRLGMTAPDRIDWAGVQAALPEGVSSQVSEVVDEIRTAQGEVRRLRVEERLASGHPQVVAALQRVEQVAADVSETLDTRLTVLETRLGQLAGERQELYAERRNFPDLENRLAELEQQKSMDDEMYQYLLSQLAQSRIRVRAAQPYVEIIDPAVGTTPIDPRGRINILLGALLGLLLGTGAAFFIEYLDRTVRTSSDVEGLLGIPVLGVVPRLRRLHPEEEVGRGGGAPAAPLVVALDPMEPAAEAYRNLRLNLNFMSSEDAPLRSILFSSPGPGEGKSTSAVNYAVMLAHQGQRVLLVDADLRRPTLHRSLDLLREPGLTNLLVGDAEPREAIRPNVLPHLDVLTAGPFPPNPSELLNSPAMARLVEELEGRYEHVIIDCPPVLAVTDAAVLSGLVDGAVLVLRSGETEQRSAERAVERLQRLGARVLGAVLNEVAITGPDEGYDLRYHYQYQPRAEGGWSRLRDNLTKVRFW